MATREQIDAADTLRMCAEAFTEALGIAEEVGVKGQVTFSPGSRGIYPSAGAKSLPLMKHRMEMKIGVVTTEEL